jgi:DNA (cytosine-5)-methyltransferase 1
MNVLDLFSGIGGFSLGLERAGMRTVAFCEIDPYCRQVLVKHWPDVPIFDDVRTLTAETLANAYGERASKPRPGQENSGWPPDRFERTGSIDVICGGFPCQDISLAGKGAGITGARSGLWKEYARIIGEVRSRYVIVENVSALLGRGLGDVLGDLAALGYDAEWHCIPASAIGAPHRRDRIWIVAYAERERLQKRLVFTGIPGATGCNDDGKDAPVGGWWAAEPDVGRMAYGIPSRVDRLRALGNAVVPQIPEIIGRAIMKAVTP